MELGEGARGRRPVEEVEAAGGGWARGRRPVEEVEAAGGAGRGGGGGWSWARGRRPVEEVEAAGGGFFNAFGAGRIDEVGRFNRGLCRGSHGSSGACKKWRGAGLRAPLARSIPARLGSLTTTGKNGRPLLTALSVSSHRADRVGGL